MKRAILSRMGLTCTRRRHETIRTCAHGRPDTPSSVAAWRITYSCEMQSIENIIFHVDLKLEIHPTFIIPIGEAVNAPD